MNKKTRRNMTFTWVLILLAAGIPLLEAQQRVSRTILAAIDSQVSFMDSDFSAEYTISSDSAQYGKSVKVAALFRRDRLDTYLILILQPNAEKGKGYLKIDNNLWLWDPKARRYTVTSARDRFQNSSARNSDFTRTNFANDYEIVASSQQKLGGLDTTVYELKSVGVDMDHATARMWVSGDGLLRKLEEYSLSKQLLRTTLISSYQKVGARYVPVAMTLTDNLRGRMVGNRMMYDKTEITVRKPSLSTVPDLVFTRAYLEKLGQ